MLTIELGDNPSGKLLAELASLASHTEKAQRFIKALAVERQHLLVVQGWMCRVVPEIAT